MVVVVIAGAKKCLSACVRVPGAHRCEGGCEEMPVPVCPGLVDLKGSRLRKVRRRRDLQVDLRGCSSSPHLLPPPRPDGLISFLGCLQTAVPGPMAHAAEVSAPNFLGRRLFSDLEVGLLAAAMTPTTLHRRVHPWRSPAQAHHISLVL